MNDLPGLPDWLLPRRGLDAAPGDYADQVTEHIMALAVDDIGEAVRDLDQRLNEEDDLSRLLAFGSLRWLLVLRQRGAPEDIVRQQARVFMDLFVDVDKHRSEGER